MFWREILVKNLTLRDSNSRWPNLEGAMFLPTEATETFSFIMGCIFYAIAYIVYFLRNNRPYPSSLGPLYQNEVKCSAFDMEMIFHSHVSKTHFHKKICAVSCLRFWFKSKWPGKYHYLLSACTYSYAPLHASTCK